MTNNTTRELTAKQELFLEYLFNSAEAGGEVKRAAALAGYSENASYALARTLRDQILARTEDHLVFSAAKAVQGLTGLMEEDNFKQTKADLKLKVVQDILDRTGVAKKQDIGVIVTSDTPLFFIPAKVVTEEESTKDGSF